MATRISVAFADSLPYFPARKTLLLGNPVRQAMLDAREIAPQAARAELGLDNGLPRLLVTGGSQGARHLNQTVCQALPGLLARCQVLQISGRELYNETRAQAESLLANQAETLRQRYRLVPYLNEQMPLALQAADLVLCRSGASTLTELAILGKPGVLVPLSPAVGGRAQQVYAALFVRNAAAFVIADGGLTSGILVERVLALFLSKTQLAAMAQAASTFARPGATRDITRELVRIAKKRTVA